MIFDAWAFLLTASPTILAILALVGILLGRARLKEFTAQLDAVRRTIEYLGVASLDDKGKPLFDFSLLLEIREQLVKLRSDFETHADLLEEHNENIEDIKRGEPWKTCLIDHCPNLSNIIHKIDILIHLFNTFDDKAQESRTQTGATLVQLSDQIDSITKQINSDAIENRKNTQEALQNIMTRLDSFLTQVLDLAINSQKKG